jgi:ELWxxDGT repeat protein
MNLSKLWRYGLLVLLVGYGVAIGCGPLQESGPSGSFGAQRSGLDNQCSPPSLVTDLNPGRAGAFPDAGTLWAPGSLASANRQLFFVASDGTSGPELWRSDGTAQGTQLVKDIVPGPEGALSGASVGLLTPAPGGFYFSANGGGGAELWKSDGTDVGTARVSDLLPGNLGSSPSSLTMAGGQLFFVASDGVRGRELWRTGADAGPVLVKELIEGPNGSEIRNLKAVGNTLFFSGNDIVHGQELWKTDGTATGTVMVKDIEDQYDAIPDELVTLKGRLYFNADDGPLGRELWTSDGTEAGTQRVKDIWDGFADSAPTELVVAVNRLFFSADDGFRGRELWTSDGTAAGTRLVRDIRPGKNIEGPTNLVTAGTRVFFLSQQTDGGSVLWTSDGAEGGTVPLKRIDAPEEAPFVTSWKGVGETLYFAGSDGVSGSELWKSDGTPEGTVRVMDIAPGAASSAPRGFTRVGLKLFFVAADPANGDELWSMELCDRSPPRVLCPPDFTFEADAGTGVAVPFSASAVDDLTDELPLVYSREPRSLFPLGVTPVTVTTQDEAGNTGSCTFQVSVRDSVPPRVTCPQPIFVEATGTDPVEVPYPEVQAADAISPVTIEFDPPPGTLFTPGESTPVLLTVKDASGNARTCRFGVTVELPGGAGGGEGEGEGCSCRALPSGASWWGALLLLLVLARLRPDPARHAAERRPLPRRGLRERS